jgi:hypothetical protein
MIETASASPISFYYYVMKLQCVIYERGCGQSIVCRGSGFVQQTRPADTGKVAVLNSYDSGPGAADQHDVPASRDIAPDE